MNTFQLMPELSEIKHVTADVDLEGLAIKKDLEYTTHVDTSSFALKNNLSSLKGEVDILDIPKLSTVPTDLSKLTNKVANDLVEETKSSALEKKKKDNLEQNKII